MLGTQGGFMMRGSGATQLRVAQLKAKMIEFWPEKEAEIKAIHFGCTNEEAYAKAVGTTLKDDPWILWWFAEISWTSEASISLEKREIEAAARRTIKAPERPTQ